MRIAALYDIHGNLPALEAVLTEVDAAGVDVVVVGGDVVAGPMPRETLDALLARGDRARFIQGNTDRTVAGDDSSESDKWRERIRWVAGQLTPGQLGLLRQWPKTLAISADGLGSILFCHGSPKSDQDIITRATPEKDVLAKVEGVSERIVVCGHTHMQFDRLIGPWRVVNAGSVGLPYEGTREAYWTLLGPDVSLRRTRYDAEDAARRMATSGFPGIDEFLRDDILTPHTPEEAIALFESLARARAGSAR